MRHKMIVAIVAAGAVALTSLAVAGVPIVLVLDNAGDFSGSAASAGWSLALCASGLLGLCAGAWALLTLRNDVVRERCVLTEPGRAG